MADDERSRPTEDAEAELTAMADFIRGHKPEVVAQLADVDATAGHDPIAVRAGMLRGVADAWKHSLRRDADYLAWRRDREPGYRPPDEPDPNAWENLTDVERMERRRAQRKLAQMGERLGSLSPDQQRIYRYVHKRQGELFEVYSKMHEIGKSGDEHVRALAEAFGEGLGILASMLTAIASGGATLFIEDDDRE